MKKTLFVVTFSLFVAWSSICVSDICYTVEGEVKTVNTSPISQSGSIDLLLLDEYDNETFREGGELDGTIIGGNIDGLLLSHIAYYEGGSTFTTINDQASVTGIRKLAEDGMPCSFFIHEEITNIVQGSGFFESVNNVKIHANGYVSTCIADGENENEFELTGTLCVD